MTDAERLSTTDSEALLKHVADKVSNRKLCLLALAAPADGNRMPIESHHRRCGDASPELPDQPMRPHCISCMCEVPSYVAAHSGFVVDPGFR